jgi:hypothetical protein
MKSWIKEKEDQLDEALIKGFDYWLEVAKPNEVITLVDTPRARSALMKVLSKKSPHTSWLLISEAPITMKIYADKILNVILK